MIQEHRLVQSSAGRALVPVDPLTYASGGDMLDKQLVGECKSEYEFEGDSKGFEGAVGVRGVSNTDGSPGQLFMLGLCEGNWCGEGRRGQEPGNGRVVLMHKGVDGQGNCVWVTDRVLSLPSELAFEDYSAIALMGDTVAITSQASSQLWLGKISLVYEPANGEHRLDPNTVEFLQQGGKVLNFPRDGSCRTKYCNVEGESAVRVAITATETNGRCRYSLCRWGGRPAARGSQRPYERKGAAGLPLP